MTQETVTRCALNSVGFVLGVLTGGILAKWNIVSNGFWKVKITQDVALLLVTIVFGLFIARHLNFSGTRFAKKTELILSKLAEMGKAAEEAYESAARYMNMPSEEAANISSERMKRLSNRVLALENLVNVPKSGLCTTHVDMLDEKFQYFRSVLTERHWRDYDYVYVQADYTAVLTAHNSFMDALQQIEMSQVC